MSIIEIEITLMYVEPKVERTLLVPSDVSLENLHSIIQEAVGWTDSHLYMFSAGERAWSLPDPDPDWEINYLPSDEITLGEVAEQTAGRDFEYVYDFGDGWTHAIKVGEARSPVSGKLYPQLTRVSGRCPPEDVGGPPGYARFLEIIADPDHPEHVETVEWCGGEFDPNEPEAEALRAGVRRLAGFLTKRAAR